MYKVLRKNKSYDKRKLVIYDEKDKKILEVTGFWGWISWSRIIELETQKVIRLDVMKNLYWLLGHDCNKADWLKSIEKWDKGFHYGPQQDNPSSKFFNEEEKELAINSFYSEKLEVCEKKIADYDKMFDEIDNVFESDYKNEDGGYVHEQSFSWGFQEGVNYCLKLLRGELE